MNWIKRSLFAGSLFASFYTVVSGQSQESGLPEFPEIKMYISESQFQNFRTRRGVKMELKKVVMLMDRDTVTVKGLHSRGLTSCQFGRKSMAGKNVKTNSLQKGSQRVNRFR